MRARARKWMERNRAVSCVKKDIIKPKIFDPISSVSFGSPQSISCVHPHICKAYVFSCMMEKVLSQIVTLILSNIKDLPHGVRKLRRRA